MKGQPDRAVSTTTAITGRASGAAARSCIERRDAPRSVLVENERAHHFDGVSASSTIRIVQATEHAAGLGRNRVALVAPAS
jgi:hypothetical protein